MNQNTLVLVVDESDSHRAYFSELLYVRKFRVLNASDCETALEILSQYPDIKMVIADFEMSSLDGCSFCRRVRENNKIEEVGIVAFTPSDDRMVGVKFIKSGASDYVVKNPFIVEECYSKINRILETMNLYSLLRKTTP
jgi:PleD family two-component response regulator